MEHVTAFIVHTQQYKALRKRVINVLTDLQLRHKFLREPRLLRTDETTQVPRPRFFVFFSDGDQTQIKIIFSFELVAWSEKNLVWMADAIKVLA